MPARNTLISNHSANHHSLSLFYLYYVNTIIYFEESNSNHVEMLKNSKASLFIIFEAVSAYWLSLC